MVNYSARTIAPPPCTLIANPLRSRAHRRGGRARNPGNIRMPRTAFRSAALVPVAFLLSGSPAALAQSPPPPPASVEAPRLPAPDPTVNEAVALEKVTFEQAVQRALARNPTI